MRNGGAHVGNVVLLAAGAVYRLLLDQGLFAPFMVGLMMSAVLILEVGPASKLLDVAASTEHAINAVRLSGTCRHVKQILPQNNAEI